MPTATWQTADDLARFDEPGKTAELVRGVLVVREPPSTSHGDRAARLTVRVGVFVAFISRDRLTGIPEAGYAELAPDLVVELLSPSDRPGEVLDKVGQWLSAGVRLVWVIDPARRLARVYRADGTESIVQRHDYLEGEDVVPGFRCPLGDIL
jgi:hypothetical protein